MEDSAEIREVAMRNLDAMCRGDTSYLERFVSLDDSTLFIGTDPNEWWAGYERIMGAWKAQFEAVGGGFLILARDLVAYRDGNMGWYAAQPVMELPGAPERHFA